MQAKRAVFGSILEQRETVHKDGWNVATSQRRDVGSTYIEVNKRQKEDQNSRGIGDQGTYELGHGIHSSRTLTLEKSHHFVSSSFRTERLMFYRLTICAFLFSMF